MEGYLASKLKRKGVEDVSDDFTDFSLSSPATKIRRLDAELPPIIEEAEPDIPIEIEQSFPHEQTHGCNSIGGIKIEELSSEPINEERAIVLFNPNNTAPLRQAPSSFSVSINPSLMSQFKSRVLWTNQSSSWRVTEEETAENDNPGSDTNGCLAVVPWVPSGALQVSSMSGAELPPQNEGSEMMDAQDVEETTMDIEDSNPTNLNANQTGGMMFNDQFRQWQQQQQQHCLVPQPPHNTTTPPIPWYR